MKNYNEVIIERSDCDGDGVDDEKMNEEFTVAAINRQDILDCYYEGEDDNYEAIKSKIENLNDKQVQQIAYGIGDIAFNHGSYYSYWDDIKDAFETETK